MKRCVCLSMEAISTVETDGRLRARSLALHGVAILFVLWIGKSCDYAIVNDVKGQ